MKGGGDVVNARTSDMADENGSIPDPEPISGVGVGEG